MFAIDLLLRNESTLAPKMPVSVWPPLSHRLACQRSQSYRWLIRCPAPARSCAPTQPLTVSPSLFLSPFLSLSLCAAVQDPPLYGVAGVRKASEVEVYNGNPSNGSYSHGAMIGSVPPPRTPFRCSLQTPHLRKKFCCLFVCLTVTSICRHLPPCDPSPPASRLDRPLRRYHAGQFLLSWKNSPT